MRVITHPFLAVMNFVPEFLDKIVLRSLFFTENKNILMNRVGGRR